jgi:bacteriocin biosynthesis cyclodehydratase domain-containing protein
MGAATLGTPDLVVFTDVLTPDPRRREGLHQEKITHLVVQLADGRGVIGPLVLPGRSSCLCCAELHRTDDDEGWPIIAAQARELVGSASAATLRATASFAVGQAVAFVDALAIPTRPPTCVDALLTLDADAGTLHREHWPAHADCGCGASAVTMTPVNTQRPAACTQWAAR